MAARSRTSTPHRPVNAGHNHAVLVLQGGGALGSYQAGVYDRLAEAGVDPGWFAVVSIGAINAALIAGNPPQPRLSAAGVATFGVPGFLSPRLPPLFWRGIQVVDPTQ